MLQKKLQITIFVADHFDVREITIFVYLCTLDLLPKVLSLKNFNKIDINSLRSIIK